MSNISSSTNNFFISDYDITNYNILNKYDKIMKIILFDINIDYGITYYIIEKMDYDLNSYIMYYDKSKIKLKEIINEFIKIFDMIFNNITTEKNKH